MEEKTETAQGGALAGIRVLELGHIIAGPYCGQLLGDMGAEVVKIEPPGSGDPMRQWGQGLPIWWKVISRNKKCVTLDLRSKEGADMFRDLVAQSDIVIENFRPGTMEKWGLGYEQLSAINPGLILVRVSGFGQTGPYAKRGGYASVAEAMAGFRYIVGEADRKPARAGISIGDSLAGLFATVGALSALHHRHASGKGQVVDAAIYESVLAVMESTVPEYTEAGHIRERSGSVLPRLAPSNAYLCRDGSHVVIGANQDSIFRRLCKAMERDELAEDPRYASHRARGEHQTELDELIEAWTRTLAPAELLARLEAQGVPSGPIYRVPEMLEDPHFAAREAIVPVADSQYSRLHMQNIFPKLSRSQGHIHWPGAELGEHNASVYRDLLGLGEAELAKLRESGVI